MSIWSKLIPYSIKKHLKVKVGVPDMFWSLQNMKNNGFNPSKIIDIGAYEGKWTLEALSIFPQSKFLLIEPLEDKRRALEAIQINKRNQITFIGALLGAEEGKEVVFNEMETASSVLMEHHTNSSRPKTKLLTTLSIIAEQTGFDKPDLIKLDTQGYELEILKGGINVLQSTQVVLMEVSLLDIHQNVPLLKETVDFMANYGFVAYDICHLGRRPLDKALWQIDIIFVKENNPLRKDKHWN